MIAIYKSIFDLPGTVYWYILIVNSETDGVKKGMWIFCSFFHCLRMVFFFWYLVDVVDVFVNAPVLSILFHSDLLLRPVAIFEMFSRQDATCANDVDFAGVIFGGSDVRASSFILRPEAKGRSVARMLSDWKVPITLTSAFPIF